MYRNILTKDIEFDALFVEPASDESLAYKDCFRRQPESELPRGIDKLTFILDRDYCNEDSLHRYKGGAVTLRTHGSKMYVDLHREYIPHGENLLDHCNNAMRYLLGAGAFKIPLKKTVYCYDDTGEQVDKSTMQFDTNHCKAIDPFTDYIKSQLRLSCIELFFDYRLPIRSYLDRKQFVEEQGTLYSPDYKVYPCGNRRKSLLCIYDKAKQLECKKHLTIYSRKLERVEFRLYRKYFESLMGDWRELLDTPYLGLLAKCIPAICKKCKGMDIDFSGLCSHLHDNDTLRELLRHVEE